jgi:hypothetical protein
MSSGISRGPRSPTGAAASAAAAIVSPSPWDGAEPRLRVAADNDAGASPETLPPLDWDQLETVLTGLAGSDDRRLMVRHLLHGARRQADALSPEDLLREIVCIGVAAMGGTGED